MVKPPDQITELARFLAAHEVSTGSHRIDERVLSTVTLTLDGGELMLLMPDLFPGAAPIALFSRDSGETEQLQLDWDLQVPAEKRLQQAIAQHFLPPGPYLPIWGSSPDQLWTRDAERGRLARWNRYFSGGVCDYTAFEADFFARTRSILHDSLQEKEALIAGCGSVGSCVAVELARAGVSSFVLIDSEEVTTANLSRTAYTIKDVSVKKVEALAGILLNINPALRLQLHACPLQAIPRDTLESLFSKATIAINAADEPFAESLLNHLAYHHEIPALFVSLFAGACGGEILFTLPGITPCLACSRGSVAALDAGRPSIDYGSGHLVAEPALGCNIHFVVNAATRLALSLLTLGDETTGMGQLVMDAVISEQNTILLRCETNFLPELFGQLDLAPGQLTFQSLWISFTESSLRCAVCGSESSRANPHQLARANLDLVQLRENWSQA
jgi:molybdopterin/thiamine biosynthesis adenylyltransferase